MSGVDFSLPDWKGEDSDASSVLQNSQRLNYGSHAQRQTSNSIPKYSEYGCSFRDDSYTNGYENTRQRFDDKENQRNPDGGRLGRDIKRDSQLGDRQHSQHSKSAQVTSTSCNINFAPVEPKIDVLEAKSWLLSQIEKLTLATESLQNVKKLIGEEIDMDKKSMDVQLMPLNSRFRSAAHYQTLPREATLMEEKWTEMLTAVRNVLYEGGEVFQSKKVAYQTQLKKVQSNANAAIRNAMQIERGETVFTCQKLKEDAEQQHQTLVTQHATEVSRLKENIHSLELTIRHLENRMEQLQEREHNRLALQQEAVDTALQRQRNEFVHDLQQFRSDAAQELSTLKTEHLRYIDHLQQTQARALDERARAEEALKESFAQEKLQLEADATHLREEIHGLQLQLTVTKEKAAHQLQEERAHSDRALSEQLAESLKAQAALKTDITNTLQHLHEEESRRQQQTEGQFERMRDQWIQQHALETEKLEERHRREMKRLQAELEARHEEEVFKLKHIHEQEVNRQIRTTDRLQRLVARHGLSTAHQEGDSSDQYSAASYAAPPVVYHQLTPTRRTTSGASSSSMYRREDEGNHNREELRDRQKSLKKEVSSHQQSLKHRRQSPSPPPPPPETNRSVLGTKYGSPTRGEKINWGALSQSLRAQESQALHPQPTFSRDHMPPSTFALDEALEATKTQDQLHHRSNSGDKSQSNALAGLGVRGNVRRVSTYLQALEDYLEGDDQAARNVDISLSTSTAISDILGLQRGSTHARKTYGVDAKDKLSRARDDRENDEEEEDEEDALSRDSLHASDTTASSSSSPAMKDSHHRHQQQSGAKLQGLRLLSSKIPTASTRLPFPRTGAGTRHQAQMDTSLSVNSSSSQPLSQREQAPLIDMSLSDL